MKNISIDTRDDIVTIQYDYDVEHGCYKHIFTTMEQFRDFIIENYIDCVTITTWFHDDYDDE